MTKLALRRIAGPAAAVYFICSWVVAGFLREGYDPSRDAISELAAQGAPYRWIVLSGMVVFGIGALVFAPLLRRPAAVALAIAGLSSFGVALFPCSPGCPRDGTTIDLIHAGFAALFYVAFTLTPPLQSRSPLNLVVTAVAGVALSLHGLSIANGLMQRIGITTLDAWLIYTGLRGRDLLAEK